MNTLYKDGALHLIHSLRCLNAKRNCRRSLERLAIKLTIVSVYLLYSSVSALAQINLPVLGDAVSGTISTQQEYEFGRELFRSIRRQTPSLNDPLIEEYITSLSYKLAAKSELTDHRLAFILIDNQLLNAFAAPGGIIGVNAGLFLTSDNEGQFASVLAHELAHISQRHYARNIEEARNNALPNLAATLASLAIMATVDGEAGQAALMTSQAARIDNQLQFSRSNEQEADRIGIRTLYNAGFDPEDMGGMFENMMRIKSFSQKPPEFLSTHPLDEDRIADSKNRAANYPMVEHIQNIEYQLMRQRVINHYADDFDALLSSLNRDLQQQDGNEADATRYGIALSQLSTGQFIKASELANTLLEKEPTRITYVLLEADIALAAEDYEKALAVLEENLQINPYNHPLTMAYAKALAAVGRYQDSAILLETQAIQKPTDMNLWFQLAETQGQAGHINKVHTARAEYFLTIGELGRARDQLNFALSLETEALAIARIKQRLKDIRELGNKFYR